MRVILGKGLITFGTGENNRFRSRFFNDFDIMFRQLFEIIDVAAPEQIMPTAALIGQNCWRDTNFI